MEVINGIDNTVIIPLNIDQSISGIYDSTSIISNKDGNVLERTEFIINEITNIQPVNVIQSDTNSIVEGSYVQFNVFITDVNGNAFTEANIDISAADIMIEKSHEGGAFSIVGIDQPILSKTLGTIFATELFSILQWDAGDIFRTTITGSSVLIGATPISLQSFIWTNIITTSGTIEEELDVILGYLTPPDIDSQNDTTIAEMIGRKGDTPKADTKASVINFAKIIYASQLSRRCNVTEVPNITNFKTIDFSTVESNTFNGWWAYVHQKGDGTDTAPAKEYRLISNWDKNTNTFTHTAFSAPITTSSKIMIIHPSIYNVFLIKTETDKIASIKTTTEAITGYALDSTVAKATTLSSVKTETDKIAAIKTTVEAITGYALDSTVAKSTVLDNVKTKTDQIGTIINTGGTATIGSILGDWLNTNLKTKVEYILSLLETTDLTTEAIEHHFHNLERWYGKKTSTIPGVNVMDDVLTPFRMDSGNNTYGTAICIVGSSDTPIINPSSIFFDIHQLLIVATERTETYKIRLTWGTTEAAGIIAGDYSTIMMVTTNLNGKIDPLILKMPRLPVGTKVWANCWCANNTGTIDFFHGLHEYIE